MQPDMSNAGLAGMRTGRIASENFVNFVGRQLRRTWFPQEMFNLAQGGSSKTRHKEKKVQLGQTDESGTIEKIALKGAQTA